jgi:hypothetical protein
VSEPHSRPPHPRPFWERRSCAHGRDPRISPTTHPWRLHPDDRDAIARKVASLIAERPPHLALRLGAAAGALGVSHDHFRKHIAPELRIVRRGRVQIVPITELQRWMNEHASYLIED